VTAVWLTAAAPAPQDSPPAPRLAPAPARPLPLASNEAIADQFMMLAFDADPVIGATPRENLARWKGPVRLFVSGSTFDLHVAEQIAAPLARATGLPFEMVAGGSPNLLVAVDADLPNVFGGPLRRLLLAAFEDDAQADAFIDNVVKSQPCWMLAVWGDAGQTLIKAAVVGIDARQPVVDVRRCMAQKLAASMGLLGPSGYLPRSVFAPQTTSTRYSREDMLMLRLLFSPSVHAGMTRDDVRAAALATLPSLRHR
jgi:hypothetical protein